MTANKWEPVAHRQDCDWRMNCLWPCSCNGTRDQSSANVHDAIGLQGLCTFFWQMQPDEDGCVECWECKGDGQYWYGETDSPVAVQCERCLGTGRVRITHPPAPERQDIADELEAMRLLAAEATRRHDKMCHERQAVADGAQRFLSFVRQIVTDGDWEYGDERDDGHKMSEDAAELLALLSAAPAAPAVDVPEEVMRALDRMCTPLDPSVLKGATADADAHCVKVIRDYILDGKYSADTVRELKDHEVGG